MEDDKVMIVGRVTYRTIMDNDRARSMLSSADQVRLRLAANPNMTATMTIENEEGFVAVIFVNSETDGGWMALHLSADMKWIRANPDTHDARFVKNRLEFMRDFVSREAKGKVVSMELTQ